jgi:hypothetical protein
MSVLSEDSMDNFCHLVTPALTVVTDTNSQPSAPALLRSV